MGLTEAEIETFRNIEKGITVGKLGEAIGKSISYTSELVKRLEEKGLVRKKRKGKEKKLEKTENRQTVILEKILRTDPQIPWENLLNGKSLEIISVIRKTGKTSEISKQTCIARNTVYRTLKKLTEGGITAKKGREYRINKRFEEITELAEAYIERKNREKAKKHFENLVIIWNTPARMIIQTETEKKTEFFKKTGFRKLEEYGIGLNTTEKYYYFHGPSETVGPTQLINHLLLIDDTVRTRTYCLVLIKKQGIPEKQALEESQKYQTSKKVTQLYNYLKKGRQTAKNPTKTEFRKYLKQFKAKP